MWMLGPDSPNVLRRRYSLGISHFLFLGDYVPNETVLEKANMIPIEHIIRQRR